MPQILTESIKETMYLLFTQDVCKLLSKHWNISELCDGVMVWWCDGVCMSVSQWLWYWFVSTLAPREVSCEFLCNYYRKWNNERAIKIQNISCAREPNEINNFLPSFLEVSTYMCVCSCVSENFHQVYFLGIFLDSIPKWNVPFATCT